LAAGESRRRRALVLRAHSPQAGELAAPPSGAELESLANSANLSLEQVERWFVRRAALQNAPKPAAAAVQEAARDPVPARVQLLNTTICAG